MRVNDPFPQAGKGWGEGGFSEAWQRLRSFPEIASSLCSS